MKLLDAMTIVNARSGEPVALRYALVTGFTPLALETFFCAHVALRRAGAQVVAEAGRYGDLAGNAERAAARAQEVEVEGAAVLVEWSDLDPRLGYRHAAAMADPNVGLDIAAGALGALTRLRAAIETLAGHVPTAVSLPTLPLPPIFLTPGTQASVAELRLRAHVAHFAAEVASIARVRVVSAQRLDAESPAADRLSVSSEISSGFPYRRPHAERVAALLAAALHPAAPKKGLITDLDDTFWRGVVGDVGVDAVSWSLEHGSQPHALYQQLLSSLAASGVLVAIASKNDPGVVAEALGRNDLLIARDRIFPVHAAWTPKSESVRAILESWNIGADSVVFVDDSAMELAEVKARFPDVECLQFAPRDEGAVVELARRLRDLFGKESVREEDRLRVDSLRASGAAALAPDGAPADHESFLAQLDPVVRLQIGRDATDERALELVNKTNQFNLNGRRYTDAEWRRLLGRDHAFMVGVSYRDKFGPLGKIAVAAGAARGGVVRLDTWVMSCRAFARRIEYRTLLALFEHFDASEIVLDVARTARNGPLVELLERLGQVPEPAGEMRVARDAFDRAALQLYGAVEVEAVHAEAVP